MTTEYSVVSVSTVTLEQLNDMLITAVEGGIGYWSEVRNYEWEESYDNHDIPVTVEIRENGEKKWHKVSAEDLLRVVPRISSVSGQASGWNLEEVMDNCDADIADIAVQLLLFDKVVYG